jgi:hypothetical protein
MVGPTVSLDATIDAAPSIVFAVLADWRQNLVWEQELRSYVPLTDEPVGAGSRFRWERQFGRRQVSGELVVTSCVRDRLLATAVPTGPVRFRSMITLAPTDGGAATAVHVELTQRPRGPVRLLAVPMARALRERAAGNLQALKNLIEQEAGTSMSLTAPACPVTSAKEGGACPER